MNRGVIHKISKKEEEIGRPMREVRQAIGCRHGNAMNTLRGTGGYRPRGLRLSGKTPITAERRRNLVGEEEVDEE
jgi:hypothetical protein